MVWDMKSPLGVVEFKESAFLSAGSCRGEREKEEKRIFLFLSALFHVQTFNFHLHGFLFPIFSWTFSV